MQVMTCYKDLVRMIGLLESQLELLQGELTFWWPNDMLKAHRSKGFMNYPLDVTMEKKGNIQHQMEQTEKILEFYKTVKDDMDKHIHSLEGLEYKVAYLRFVEDKTYKEIADDLGYNYDYIRQVASRSKGKELTITSQTS